MWHSYIFRKCCKFWHHTPLSCQKRCSKIQKIWHRNEAPYGQQTSSHILQVITDYILHTDYVLKVGNLLDYVLQVRTDYVLQVRNLLTMYYKLELTMYYYCLWYDKLWGPSQRVVTLFMMLAVIIVSLSIPSKLYFVHPKPAKVYCWTKGAGRSAWSRQVHKLFWPPSPLPGAPPYCQPAMVIISFYSLMRRKNK